MRSPLLVLALLVGANVASAQAGAGNLYLLAGTPSWDGWTGSPTTLYTAGPAASAVKVRQVAAGLFGVRAGPGGTLYVLGAARESVSVIHEDDPSQPDSVRLHARGHKQRAFPFVWSGWGAAQCGGVPCAVFPDRSGHSASVTVVLAEKDASRPRVAHRALVVYGGFRFDGRPGGPVPAIGPLARVVDGELEIPYWLGAPEMVIARGAGRAGVADGAVFLDADTSQYILVSPLPLRGGPGPLAVYVEAKRSGFWQELAVQTANPGGTNQPPLRLFGQWLATTVKLWRGPGDTTPSPGQQNERSVGSVGGYSNLPNVRWLFNEQGTFYMPGRLELDNLADGRRLMIDTGQQDSEVLNVSKSGQVLYRVNDEIFSAQIEGDKIGPSTLVVKGEDVPEVHWVFWSKAKPPSPPAKVPSGNPR